MGLRCLIDHDYGEPQTSRERSQRGNEVVVTVREYRECTRCGHTKVISENKEITADESVTDDKPAAEASWTAEEDRETGQASVDAYAKSSSDTGAGAEEQVTAAEDDGIILDDESEAPERAHGEWPEADLGEAPAEAEAEADAPWPEEDAEAAPEPPEPEEPERPDPDEDPLDVGPEPTAEPADADDAAAAEPASDEADQPSDESDASRSAPDQSAPPRPDDRDTEFVCPDCGETWTTRNASLRPGDICPECKGAYLDERVIQ